MLQDQAITGVSPAQTRETTVMTVWPSNAYFSLGRMLGQMYEIRFPDIWFLRVGNLIALLSIPVALALFFMRVAPGTGIRYTLTNRRVVVFKGLLIEEDRSVALDKFDSIQVVVQPGQAWYDAGDLAFFQGKTETFRLEGVSRPEAFRQSCMKAHLAYVGVKKAQARAGVTV
jgi:Bacterial PH domain